MPNNKDILPPLTFLSYSLGCRTNQAEMENIGLQLTDYGLRQIKDSLQTTAYRLQQKEPDLVLLNTCVVTVKAEKETRQKIRELRKKYPKSFLVVLGCAVTTKEKFKIKLPEANLFISNEGKENIIKIIVETQNFASLQNIPFESKNCSSILLNNKYIQSGRKFIKIQDGCNGGCSFCLTQYLRGTPASIPLENIIKEINFWVNKGIKEIILTGINIKLYDNLSELINKILNIKQGDSLSTQGVSLPKQIERISFSSIYPEMLTKEFLALVVENPRITQCFHLSLQSGSQTVLKRMNRKTDINELLKKMQWIKEKNPLFTFRADIITGLPDETEKEFQETLDFIKKAKISFIHSFLFNMRPHTKAEVMIKNKVWKEIPNEIKKQRSERLNKVVEEVRKEEAEKMIDSLFHCLIIKKIQCHSRESGNLYRFQVKPGMTMWEGITENGWLIKIKSQKSKIKTVKGKILPVKITGFEEDYLLGKIVDLPTKGTKTSGILTLPSGF